MSKPDPNRPARVQPRTLKGFRDHLPEAMIPRERLIDTARRVYRSFGFSPIDTPALEYLDILTGGGGAESDKQLYRFEDQGGRQVGMRFDLTVPLARFVAQHAGQLVMPFKRYHIANVWRGENTQRGRYREFMQCDFDTVGTLSVAADIETGLVIHDLLLAIGFEGFTIRVNNRKILNGLLAKLGLEGNAAAVLRALDKLAKIGPEKVAAEMIEVAGASAEQAAQVLQLSEIGGDNEAVLAQLEPLVAGNEIGEEGLSRLRETVAAVAAAGVPSERFVVDPLIARGLDYYTGTVFETFLDALPDIGSVCSGGRYDNLAERYTKQQLPGIGASLGLDRLLAAMEELDMIERVGTPASVLIAYFDKTRLHDYLRLAAVLRAGGIAVEVFPEPKKLGQQLKYADKKGFRIALVAGEDELAGGRCQVKDLTSGERHEVSLDEVVGKVREVLAEGQRDGGTEGQRDRGTEGQRDWGTGGMRE
ncbi:MAG: histidine--tRNA ligase [Planctomycetes bacterium]|nr:histidine--tRNA ligase [Planctomycetota bacterium]